VGGRIDHHRPGRLSLALWNYDGMEQILRADCDLDRVRRKDTSPRTAVVADLRPDL
jgi:hypothetical protein